MISLVFPGCNFPVFKSGSPSASGGVSMPTASACLTPLAVAVYQRNWPRKAPRFRLDSFQIVLPPSGLLPSRSTDTENRETESVLCSLRLGNCDKEEERRRERRSSGPAERRCCTSTKACLPAQCARPLELRVRYLSLPSVLVFSLSLSLLLTLP